METYTLKFAGDSRVKPKSIVFEAEDASAALTIAHREAPHNPAELWQGDKKLCTIRRDPVGDDDFWEVSD